MKCNSLVNQNTAQYLHEVDVTAVRSKFVQR